MGKSTISHCMQYALSRAIVLVLLLVTMSFSRGEAAAQLGPQELFLLKDINQTILPLDASPSYLTLLGDRVFFFARGHRHGWGLWSSDGTAEGTRFISDFGKSFAYEGWEVRAVSTIGTSLVFVFDDRIHGAELWRSDGTSQGTALVRDLNPGPESGIAVSAVEQGLVTTDRQAFFVAYDGARSWGLWSSDGTADGTVLLRELAPYSEGDRSPGVDMFALGDLIYFSGSDATHGWELWVSDGTPAGTRLVRDIYPGPTAGNPYAFGAIGETVLFTADDGVHGYELWRSDGTESGTRLVADINPGPGSSKGFGWPFTAVDNQSFFLADDGVHGHQLWRSDGTGAGTAMVPRPPDDSAPFPDGTVLHAGAGCVFVEAHDPSATRLLTSCNGSVLGLLRTFGGEPQYALNFSFRALGTNTVFIVRQNIEEGLWLTDGTPAGTIKIAQLVNAWSLTPLAEHVLFSATTSQYGRELWRSDGTVTGTQLVKDLNASPAGSTAMCLDSYGGQLFFSADDGVHGQEVWLSDGTTAGTRLLADLLPGPGSSGPCGFTPFGGTLVFVAAGKLWRTDGTTAGTTLIRTADQPDGVAAHTGLSVVGDQGFFTAGPLNSDLWVLSADLSTARLVYSFQLTGKIGAQPISPRYALQHHLMFVVWEYYGPLQLWASDGTSAGTRLIAPDVAPLDRLGDRLLFMRLGFDEGENALWASDGTPEGTTRLTEAIGQYAWNHNYLGDSASGRLFFAESLSIGGGWIAVSDGSEAGTQVLQQLAWPVDSLVATNDGAFFVQYQASPQFMNAELWHTNGTSDGTRLVRSFASANWNVEPGELTPIGHEVLFAGGDVAHGRELWISDGTSEGTAICRDLNPGPASSSPRLLGDAVVLNNRLLLVADDDVHGHELWSLPLSTPCGLSLHLPLITSVAQETRR